MKEALLYEKIDHGGVHCFLCAHHCHIAEGKFGVCGVRQNIKGLLYSHVYGKIIASHVDPVEKKPLYHFLPGSSSFSIATVGCNFRCGFCQNWEISQQSFREEGKGASSGEAFPGGGVPEEIPPAEIVEAALRSNCKSISYTYTEPTIFFEYAYETAQLARERGLRNIFVTNGYMTRECLEMIRPCLDAANVDLKFFEEDSYKRVCSGSLAPVLESIRLMKEMGVWVEVTTLIVPGENDSEEELTGIARFIAGVNKDIPWHISRFHPDYKFTRQQATPQDTLKKAEGIGRACGLTYIYAGNVSGWGTDTICPRCKKVLVKREIFDVLGYNIKKGACSYCNARIAGVFG